MLFHLENTSQLIQFHFEISARRRVAAKRKKLKNLGKSKSTDTEDEDADDDCGDEGEFHSILITVNCHFFLAHYISFIDLILIFGFIHDICGGKPMIQRHANCIGKTKILIWMPSIQLTLIFLQCMKQIRLGED